MTEDIADLVPEIAEAAGVVDIVGELQARFPEAQPQDIIAGIGLCMRRIAEEAGIELPTPRARDDQERTATALLLPHVLALDGIQMHRTMAMVFCLKIVPGVSLRDFLLGEQLSHDVMAMLAGEGADNPRAWHLCGRTN